MVRQRRLRGVGRDHGGALLPSEDQTVALIAAFSGYAVGYLVRPIAGTIIGRFADTWGRRNTLILTIAGMSLGTAGIGFLPTYAQIGVAATILLVLMRVVQSIGASAEYTTTAAFLLEHQPDNRKNRLGGYTAVGAFAGFGLAGLVAAALATMMSEETFHAWGWRVAFLIALPLAGIGLYMRKRLEDTPEFQWVKEKQAELNVEQKPFSYAVRTQWKAMLLMFVLGAGNRGSTFVLSVYLVPALILKGFSDVGSYSMLAFGNLAVCPVLVLAGIIADRIHERNMLILGYAFTAASIVPIFMLVGSGQAGLAYVALALYAVGLGATMGPLTTMFVSVFPPDVRGTASGLTYNVVTTAIGSTAPIVGVWLTSRFGDLAVSYYLAFLSVLSLVAVLLARRFISSAKIRHSLSETGELAARL
ncbi:MAG: MFS transporter [Streptosporangiales bacterium]|nr:MFS transporter [Streptosporangiales bacterium]